MVNFDFFLKILPIKRFWGPNGEINIKMILNAVYPLDKSELIRVEKHNLT